MAVLCCPRGARACDITLNRNPLWSCESGISSFPQPNLQPRRQSISVPHRNSQIMIASGTAMFARKCEILLLPEAHTQHPIENWMDTPPSAAFPGKTLLERPAACSSRGPSGPLVEKCIWGNRFSSQITFISVKTKEPLSLSLC